MAIWVTLLTIAGTLMATWLGAWLVGRQAAKDLRSNIDRELAILGKLKPDSDEAKLLSGNVADSIRELVAQDDLRRERAQRDYSTAWLFGSFSLISFSIGPVAMWRNHGHSEPVSLLIEFVFWPLWAVYVGLLIRVLLVVLPWTRVGVRAGSLFARLGWAKARIAFHRARRKWARRRTEAVIRAMKPILDSTDALSEWHAEHDGNELAPQAIAQRDALVANQKALVRRAKRRTLLLRLMLRAKHDDI